MKDATPKVPLNPNERAKLLATVAGNIAGTILNAPSPATIGGVDAIAEVAVDLAEAILRRVGV